MIDGNQNRTAIYRTNKQGSTILFEAALHEIRRVADDLNEYFYFGLALADCIAVKIHGWDRQAGTVVFRSWPDKPPLPTPFLKAGT